MKNNLPDNKLHWLYLAGFFVILFLPITTMPPWFFPPDWGKTIIFRSILSILIFLFIWQILYTKRQIQWPIVKKNIILWLLITLFSVFLLATIFSQDPYFSLWGSPERSGGFINFSFYIIFSMLAFFILKKANWQKIWNFSIGIGVLVCCVAIIQFYGLFPKIFITVLNSSPSTLGNRISLGMYLLFLFFITLSLALKEHTAIKKIFYFICLSLFFYIILISGGRAAYLGLFIGIIYFLLFYPIKNKSPQTEIYASQISPASHKAFGDLQANQISKGTYPKKMLALKFALVIFLALVISLVYYANTNPNLPIILKQNKVVEIIYPRLSISQFLNDARFSAWQIAFNALKEKPILGWGPENFSVGFDKHYDPSLPYLSSATSDWWDKGHNILLDIGIQAGILGILAYLALLSYLFWKLQKTKSNENKTEDNKKIHITIHGIQTALIAYFVANLFSFDNFETYLLFFLIIGYSLHLIYGEQKTEITQNHPLQKKTEKLIAIFILFFILIIFIWHYNIGPFQINEKINIASDLKDNGKCDGAFRIMDKAITQNSFLYVHSRAEYVDFIKSCASLFNSKDNITYTTKALSMMQEAVIVQPLFTRLWIFLGAFTTVKANAEQDINKKTELLTEAKSYLKRADQLAPNHHEVIIEQIKNDTISGDIEDMAQQTQKCVAIYSTMGDCWWYKALFEIYVKNLPSAKKTTQTAKDKNFDTKSISSLGQLANAYAYTKDYANLALIYQELIQVKPQEAQYHSSLAFTYSKLGEYKKAREEALIFLKLMPGAKDEVSAFLKTLP